MKYCNITLFRYTLQISFKDGLCNVFFSFFSSCFLSLFSFQGTIFELLKLKVQYLTYVKYWSLGFKLQIFIFSLNFVSDEELCEALYICICEHLRRRIKQNLVGSSGLEPPTSRLSGVRSNHLSYEPLFGGDKRDRTADPLLAKQVLSQLSYTPTYLGAFSVLPLSRSLRTSKIKQRF